jgi:hypothetical protein
MDYIRNRVKKIKACKILSTRPSFLIYYLFQPLWHGGKRLADFSDFLAVEGQMWRATAYFLTIVLYVLGDLRWKPLAWLDVTWLGLNSLVMLGGLMLVIMGIYHFFSRVFDLLPPCTLPA